MAQINQGLLLYWTDGLNPPRKINIERCKNNFYGGNATEDNITAIKGRPTTPIYGTITSDTTYKTNNIKGKLFQFKYRYIYLDGEVSAWSSVSKLFEAINEDFYSTTDLTTNNAILLTLQYNDNIDCAKIEIAGQIKNDANKDFFSIATIPNLTLTDVTQVTYTFRNDGQYSSLDINESNLDQDFLPKLAETQELVNGNVIVYGNVTDGFDPVETDITISTVYDEIGTTPSSGSVSMVNNYHRYDHSDDRRVYRITITGSPEAGDVFEVKFTNASDVLFTKASYTVVGGDDLTDVTNAIYADLATPSAGPSVYDLSLLTNTTTLGYIEFETRRWEETPTDGAKQVITSASASVGTRYSFKEYKQNAWYQMGLVYYDRYGRHGNVETTNDTKTLMPPSGTTPYIQGYASSMQLNINHLPPDWAETFQVVRTKNLSYERWLYWVSKADKKTIGSQAYIDFDIVTLNTFNAIESSSVLQYTFVKGDRLRIRDNVDTPNDLFTTTVANDLDFEILNYEAVADTDGNITNVFLRIADGGLTINETDNYLIEIYTPRKLFSQDNQNVFYEIGEKYNIITDVNGNRVHEGTIQDQSTDISAPAVIGLNYNGDSYVKVRSIPTVNDTLNPLSVTVVVEDPNFSDYYESAVYDDGYANIIDINAKEVKRPTTIYYSQTFVPNSNINGLSRFFPLNFEEYDRNKGAIKKLALRDNYLIMYQQIQTGFVPVYRSIIEDLSSSGQVGLSQRLLQNTATYYQFDNCGIGEAASSFARVGNNFYHVNPSIGTVFRLSAAGMDDLSTTYGMNYYFSNKLKNYIGEDKVIGYVDTDKSEYIITFEGIDEVTSEETIAFNESTKMFSSYYSFIADDGFTAGNNLFTLKNGRLWKHEANVLRNNFYGVQYDSVVEPVWNDNPLLTKSFTSLALQTNGEWSATIETELSQESNLQVEDFYVEDLGGGVIMKDREGVKYASFLRDENSDGGILEGDKLKGVWIKVRLTNGSTDAVYLFSTDVKASVSPQGIR